MSDIEKLRALLAEARGVARSVRNAGSLPYAQWSRDQHKADSLIERIDAALAEPKPEPKKKAERVAVIVKEFPLDWGSLVLRVGEEIELDDTNFVGPDGLHHCIGFKAYVVVPHSYFEVRHVQ